MAVLAPVLVRARTELNNRYPTRDRSSDGWIGDAKHRAEKSDHNPNGRGVVDAIDIDVDGIPCALIVAILITHPSVNYVIWNRKIWSRSRGFRAAVYTGVDPHTNHIHVSILQSVAAENSTRAWGIATGIVIVPVVQPIPNPAPGPIELSWVARLAGALPVLRQGPGSLRSVRKMQALINAASGNTITEDGGFGPKTVAAVLSFQRAYRLTADGVVGAKTWAALLGELPTVRKGTSSIPVIRLQGLLNVFGYGLREDGVFGGGTQAAVEAFQNRYGLRSDGVAGPITYTALLTR